MDALRECTIPNRETGLAGRRAALEVKGPAPPAIGYNSGEMSDVQTNRGQEAIISTKVHIERGHP
jgi:hypothetical protein